MSALAFRLVMPITFFSHYQFSRWVFVIAFFCAPIFLVVEKHLIVVCVRALRAKGIGVQRVLVYGAGSSGRRVFSALARSAPKLGLKPVAIVDDNPDLAGKEVFSDSYRRQDSVKVICEPITERLFDKLQCEFLVIAIPNLEGEKFAKLVQIARNANVRIAFVPAQTTAINYWTEEADIDGMMLSLVGRASKGWHYEAMKRPSDLLASLILIVALLPVLILVAVLVRAGSPGGHL